MRIKFDYFVEKGYSMLIDRMNKEDHILKAKSRRQNAKTNTQPARNTQAAKPETSITEEIVLQFGQNEITIPEISAKVKDSYKNGGSTEPIRELKIYVKPEENKAYYVINGSIDGSVDLA